MPRTTPETSAPSSPRMERKPAGTAPKRTRKADATGTKPEGGDAALLPLDYMLQVLRDPETSATEKRWAAEKSAPYLHPRLSSVDHRGDNSRRHEDLLDALDEEET